MPNPIKVLIIDDHHLFVEGVKTILYELPDFEVCGQVFMAKNIDNAIQTLTPDLILLDINLHGENGIEIGARILKQWPVKIIILTMYNQPKIMEEVQKFGFHGYLLKDSTKEEIIEGIREVSNGRNFFDNKVSDRSSNSLPYNDDFARKLNLTFREVELIRLLKQGLRNEEIARRLNLSVFTIKTHRKNIHYKLGINSVAELIYFANQNGI
ncbi:response regulator transcription factor [Emticicia sp. BO119]|uniref:response regulator n=1 Tax=Emticicia sp. BO119 TaxID=2757768 RepID=UPI0015F122A8|nr:response regulator transcription factor [Emticicia sp. BO119]MBA4850277.1 response regulator transcription factor [Emticicia sp. BO119]